MSTIQIIENKISYLQKRLLSAKKYQCHSLEEMIQNETIRDAIERKLYIVSQASIDLAEVVVAFKEFRKPTTMREAIDILGEEGIVPTEFAGRFHNIVGFRNALAHDYEDLKIEVVYDVLQNKLVEVEEFIKYIQNALNL